MRKEVEIGLYLLLLYSYALIIGILSDGLLVSHAGLHFIVHPHVEVYLELIVTSDR